jgi:creatinine amidohydrolase/Fe(II)-dependent formamide hydrolase-like protein
MRYALMLPREIRAAIDDNWPVVLAVGVLEYHGEHMAVGMDTLAVTRILEILEREGSLVILPPFYYGAASYAVEPPERTGTLHVDAEALMPLAKAMFTGLLRIGFRNIHLVIHHQTENFAAGMPTDLAFKLAARQAIFAFLEAQRGEGWWGAKSMADYYEQQSTGDDPFNWIKAHPLMPSSLMEGYPFDHAGQGETSLLMALLPEGVDMSRISEDQWYSRSALQATPELGVQGRDRILAHLRKALGVERASVQGSGN